MLVDVAGSRRVKPSSDDVIDRVKVREVAGVFYSARAMEDAVEELLLNGFDRADIDRLASQDEVGQRFKTYVAPEAAAEVRGAPRQPAFTRDDVTVALVAIVSLAGAAVGMAVGFIALAYGAGQGTAIGVGALAGIIAAGVAEPIVAHAFRRQDVESLAPVETARGLVLWARVRSPEQEKRAQEIMRRNGGRAVRVHEIEIEKRAEDLPLASLRPDPWLGSEPLARV
jgi:hypothetical protein